MLLQPSSLDELSRLLAEVSRRKTAVPGANLRRMRALLEHQPEDMTATVQAGMTLDELQKTLLSAGQFLPIDPPESNALTLADLLAFDISGPRRLGYGTIRDYVIGLKVVLADGTIIKAGGKVVKNVAGYDLCKLFIGARHSLGLIVEVTFKLRPKPEEETILSAFFPSLEALGTCTRAILETPTEPCILDAHNLHGECVLITAVAGSREDVEYQRNLIKDLAEWHESDTRYDSALRWPDRHRVSVLPSEVIARLGQLAPRRFIARIGNGVIYLPGSSDRPAPPNKSLMDRVKLTYDPHGIFPQYSA